VQDLAKIKAKAKSQGIGYQNLIQALVANYVNGKISLKIEGSSDNTVRLCKSKALHNTLLRLEIFRFAQDDEI
jgi:hypothetical protein